jgi:Na+/proline symporter
LDYAIFIVLLVVSLVVGFYYAWKYRNNSAESFLLNNDSMNAYAAAFSVFVSCLSAITIIGLPPQVKIIILLSWFLVYSFGYIKHHCASCTEIGLNPIFFS